MRAQLQAMGQKPRITCLLASLLPWAGTQGLVRCLDLLLAEAHIALGLTGARAWSELSAEDVEESTPVSNRLGWFSAFPHLASMDLGDIGSLSY